MSRTIVNDLPVGDVDDEHLSINRLRRTRCDVAGYHHDERFPR